MLAAIEAVEPCALAALASALAATCESTSLGSTFGLLESTFPIAAFALSLALAEWVEIGATGARTNIEIFIRFR